MIFTAKRFVGAGVIAIVAIVTPISVTALTSGPTALASQTNGPVAGCSNPTFDVVCYVQSTTSPVDTFQFTAAGTANTTSQTATVSGTCATVTAPPPYLSMCGVVYSSSTYAGSSKAASLGTNGTATGVGAVSPAWTIDNKQTGNKQQAEAIDFSPGSAAVIGSRLFNDAQIQIQRKDTGVAQNPFVTVQLAELDSSGNVLATQNCTISGNTGTQITADTDGAGTGGNCGPAPAAQGGGPAPASFQTVEVRDLTVSTSISVVNTAVFTLINQVCGGHFVDATNTTGIINFTARLSLPNGAPCKTYSSFISSIQPNGQPLVTFNGASNTQVQFTVQVTWPVEPACQPYADPNIPPDLQLNNNVPCPPHQVSFDGVTYYDQTYCQTANPSPPQGEPQAGLCTANKQYNLDSISIDPNTQVETTTPLTMPDGSPATQLVETWVGFIDYNFR